MSDDTKRDWAADLALCEAATEVYEHFEDEPRNEAEGFARLSVANSGNGPLLAVVLLPAEDVRFAVEARTGWPAAIREAMKVEGLELRLAEMMKAQEDWCADCMSVEFANRDAGEAQKKVEALQAEVERSEEEKRRLRDDVRIACEKVEALEAEREEWQQRWVAEFDNNAACSEAITVATLRAEKAEAEVDRLRHTIRVLMEHVFPSAGVPVGALSAGEEIVRLQDSCLDGWRTRAEKAEAEVARLKAWQLQVAKGTGYCNTGDGVDGYEVADPGVILAAWSGYQERAHSADAARADADELRADLRDEQLLLNAALAAADALREGLREVLEAESSSEEADGYGRALRIAATIMDRGVKARAEALLAKEDGK